MDLNELTPKKQTNKTTLKHPKTGEPLKHNKKEMWIERYLPHTSEYKKVRYAHAQKYLNKKQEDISLFEVEQDGLELLVGTTANWQIFYDGQWVEFTKDNARKVYTEAFWIADQLKEDEDSVDLFTVT